MKLLVVSDSHGEREILKQLHEKYNEKVDRMIHCGDSELKADDNTLAGYSVVAGNCDFDHHLLDELVLDVDNSIIFVAHGHMHHIHSSLMTIAYRAKEVGADYVFFGHSHLLGVEVYDGIVFVNPGSISLPRGGNEKSYVLITKNENEHIVQFFNDDHQEIKRVDLPIQ